MAHRVNLKEEIKMNNLKEEFLKRLLKNCKNKEIAINIIKELNQIKK